MKLSVLPLPPAPADRVVRAVLAASRLTPGDRVLLHGPFAVTWEPVLEHLGLRVERDDTPAAAPAGAPGTAPAAAFEAALYVGPADGTADRRAAAAAAFVRPGRNSVAAERSENFAAAPPADGLRLADRRAWSRLAPFTPAGPGGWAVHTTAGAAVRIAARPAIAPKLAAAA